MLAKITVSLNLIWQSVFLVGAVESVTKLNKLGVANVFSFGELWPTILWGSGVISNLFFLIYLFKLKGTNNNKKTLLFSILLAVVPFVLSYLVGSYYQIKFLNSITQQ